MPDNQTIAAIATPLGMGGVGVIRVSGNRALKIAKKITGKVLKPRYVHYANFYSPSGEVIDCGVVLYFNAPHSYTGEDVVEFQGHGGAFVLQSVLQLVLSHGARQARPGEFTERAFLNDKMDLVQAEAVANLIEARSQSAQMAAMRSLSGMFSDVVNQLQTDIISLRVYVEAALDFSDEEIDFLSDNHIANQIKQLLQTVQQTLDKATYGQLLQEGVQVVLVGEPNVGKSSLLNRLLGQERAIVTAEAGTTRDTLEETINLGGVPVKITDTAGLRETENPIEQAGIDRAKAVLQSADLAIWLRDGRDLTTQLPSDLKTIDYIEVHNKSDLYQPKDHKNTLAISAKTGQGITELLAYLTQRITKKHSEEGTFSARQRHLQALKETQVHIQEAQHFSCSSSTAELVAEELRLAQQSLSELTGAYHNDELLGEIFSSFCVGK